MEEILTILDNPIRAQGIFLKKRLELSRTLHSSRLEELQLEEDKEQFRHRNHIDKFDKKLIDKQQFNQYNAIFNYEMYAIMYEKKQCMYDQLRKDCFDARVEKYKEFIDGNKDSASIKKINNDLKKLIIDEIIKSYEAKLDLAKSKLRKFNYVNQNVENLQVTKEDNEEINGSKISEENFYYTPSEIEKANFDVSYINDELLFFKENNRINSIVENFNILEVPIDVLSSLDASSIYVYLEKTYFKSNEKHR